MKKLTLSAEPDVIAEAHRLAELQGTSVSAMFSRIVRLLSRRDRERPRLGPGAKKASGLIQLPDFAPNNVTQTCGSMPTK